MIAPFSPSRTTVMAMGRLNNVWDQLFPVERHRIANLMIERIDLVHTGEVQGILDETLPENVSLFDLAVDTPLSWEEQRRRVEQAASKPRRAGNQPPAAQT